MDGHDRQQYGMFYADLFTQCSYIGFLDTDTLFEGMILPQTLFANWNDVFNLLHTNVCKQNKTKQKTKQNKCNATQNKKKNKKKNETGTQQTITHFKTNFIWYGRA